MKAKGNAKGQEKRKEKEKKKEKMKKSRGLINRLFFNAFFCKIFKIFMRKYYEGRSFSFMMQDICKSLNIPIQDNNIVLLSNVLKTRDLIAEDVMIPRVDISFLRIDHDHKQLIDFLCAMPHSRYPLYSEEKDKVTGVVHVKDVFKSYLESPDDFDLDAIKRPALFVSPGMPVLDLLLRMRVERMHMALVVDEYGGIDGIITMEDMVEQIVGDIHDEHDTLSTPEAKKDENGAYLVDGRFSFDEFSHLINLPLRQEDNEDIDTVGGFVFHLAGRVPKKGETVVDEKSSLSFEIVEGDRRRIHKVKVAPFVFEDVVE